MTYSASSKRLFVLIFILSLGSNAQADSNLVAVAAGRDSSEAIVGVLKSQVPKNIHAEPLFLRSVLANEVLPFASHFVSSYKILEGGSPSYVSVEANVDLPVIQSLYAFTPKNVGLQEEEAKIALALNVPKLPTLEGLQATNYYSPLISIARDALQRRKFSVLVKSEIATGTSSREDPFSNEALRAIGKAQNAPLAIGISVYVESEENENSHAEEIHIVLRGALIDANSGAPLARLSSYFLFPKVRKDQIVAEFQRLLSETSKEFMVNMMIQAGQHYLGAQQQDVILVEIKYPPSALIVNKFRSILEGSREIKSIVESKVERGSYVLAIQGSMDRKGLLKKILGMKQDEFVIAIEGKPELESGMISLQLKAKASSDKPVTVEMEDKQTHEGQ